MAAPTIPAAGPAGEPAASPRAATGLILAAVAALVAFYYLARADTLGVLREGQWRVMTLPPLAPARHFALSALLLGVLPVVAARSVLRLRPPELGLGAGRWRAGLLVFAAALPLALLAGWIGAGSPPIRAVYPLDPGLTLGRLPGHALEQGLYFLSWEVLFRGVLLFGLAPRLGSGTANALQTALSVLAHLGRPLEETFAAIPAGYLFGAVDLRLGSIWYVAALHWIEGAALDLFILLR